MRLRLLRHGQTHANVSGALDTGFPGLDLTDLGQRQARAAARELAGTGIEAIAVSVLARTAQTAQPLAEHLGLEPSEHHGLREVIAGDFEMRNDHEAIDGFLGTVAAWLDGGLDRRMPGGETGAEFLARYDEAVHDASSQGVDSLLIVSHGAAIRSWVTHRAGGTHAPIHHPLHNTACITLDGSPEKGWQILEWHRDPIGGRWLEDESAPDPTGEDPQSSGS